MDRYTKFILTVIAIALLGILTTGLYCLIKHKAIPLDVSANVELSGNRLYPVRINNNSW